jgi:hypothetical protein
MVSSLVGKYHNNRGQGLGARDYGLEIRDGQFTDPLIRDWELGDRGRKNKEI